MHNCDEGDVQLAVAEPYLVLDIETAAISSFSFLHFLLFISISSVNIRFTKAYATLSRWEKENFHIVVVSQCGIANGSIVLREMRAMICQRARSMQRCVELR
jgi:hypothetical protein